MRRIKTQNLLIALIAVSLLSIMAPAVIAADLDEIKERGVIRHLGIPYANFVTGSGDGMDVELIQIFAKSIGVKYEYVKTDWGTVVQDLIGSTIAAKGNDVELLEKVPVKGDLIGNGFTILPWRQKVVEFSQPTFPSQIWLVAHVDSPMKPIKPTGSIEKDIEVTRSLMKERSVLSLEKTCLDPKLYNLSTTGARIINFRGQLNQIAPALMNNEAELTILDVPDALIALGKWPAHFKIIGPISAKQQMATAFQKNSPKLLAAYNRFLTKIKKDGTYMKLVNKYYPSARMYFPEFFKGMR
jgi:hypothetical protein